MKRSDDDATSQKRLYSSKFILNEGLEDLEDYHRRYKIWKKSNRRPKNKISGLLRRIRLGL